MAKITHGPTERYRVLSPSGEPSDFELPLSVIPVLLRRAKTGSVALYVDGWSEPWPCSLEQGEVRARCPTASEFVRPRVVAKETVL